MKRLICLVAILASCTSTPKATLKNVAELKKSEAQVKVIDKKLSNRSKIYVDGALTALKKEKEKAPEKTSKEVNVAIRLLEDTVEIMGPPLPTEKLNIPGIIAKEPGAEKVLEALEQEHKKDMLDKQKLTEQINTLQSTIADQAEKLAIIQNKSWWTRLKESISGYVTMFFIVLFLVFFGPKLIKFLFRLFVP